ncbi:DMT family transporter [Micromonospora chersina]|uniref:DMT family transporter n=1 Tax=Micromonospora chersina TaxID=47854 RepID=UPI003712F56F
MQLSWVRRPDVLMVITSAPTYVATSEVLRVVGPLDLTPARFLGAACLIGLFLLARRQRLLVRGWDVVRVFAVSAVGYAGYGTLLNLGQMTVPAGTTSLLLNTSPVFAFVLGYLVLGERTTPRGVAGMVIAVVGVGVVTVVGGGSLGFDWNALLILAAALILALFLIWQQPLLRRVPAVEMVFWGCTWGGLLTLPLARFDLRPEEWEGRTWVAAVVLVICSTALAYSFWNLSLAGTSVAEGGSLLLAVPLFSIALGWLLLHQTPTLAAVVGGCIAVGGVTLLNRAGNEAHRETQEDVVTTAPVDEDVVELAIPPAEAEALQAIVGRAVERVGARLATVSLWRPQTEDLVRVYTSMPGVYRPGGVSAELGDDWVRQCVVRQESYVAETPSDLESDAFEHQDTLAALRLGAAINAVVAADGRFLGCLNLLDSPGSYGAEDLAAADAAAHELADVLARLSRAHEGTAGAPR